MSGLRLILTEAASERAAAAIELAATWAALGRPAAILLRGSAVHLPAETCAMLIDLGVGITACQTALATADMAASALPAGVKTGGMVAFLSGDGDAPLLV